MTPVCIHNLTVFVTVKIPEAGTDSLIEQCQIYMIPVDLYGHNPDLSARLICRIQAAAAAGGLFYPPDPGEKTASIGGNE